MAGPTTWQTGSVGLKRAADLQALGRVGGLTLLAVAPNGSWPSLHTQGGVAGVQFPLAGQWRIIPDKGAELASTSFTWRPFHDGTALGQISIPGQSVPNPTETSGWEHCTLTYAGMFALTLSRLTPAVLLETTRTTVRLCSGAPYATRTLSGSTITQALGGTSRPRYVAYHTAAGYQVTVIPVSPSAPLSLAGMDQPWILVWWGNQSHWLDSTLPMNYSQYTGAGGGWPAFDAPYAYQADQPLLLTFGVNPASIQQDATAGGFDLAFGASPDAFSVLPLYGRLHQSAATTEGWASGLPSAVQAKIQAWSPRLYQYPLTAAESYAYGSAQDRVTGSMSFTYRTIRAGGVQWAPLPPMLSVARQTALASLAISATVTAGGIVTEYGPCDGVEGASSYSWTLDGMGTAASPRPGPGPGTVPATLQNRLNAEADRVIGQAHWAPWVSWTHQPQQVNPAQFCHFNDPAEGPAIIAEVIPLLTPASRQTAVRNWLAADIAAYPPQTIASFITKTAVPDGVDRSSQSVYKLHHRVIAWLDPLHFSTRPHLYAAWAWARVAQEAGITVTQALVTALLAILEQDMAELDWATGHWFASQEDIPYTAVENITRHWCGLAGLAWLCGQVGDTANADLARALLARATVTRVAFARLPVWLSQNGLRTTPQDLGSPALNADWMQQLLAAQGQGGDRPGNANGQIWALSWVDGNDDPCVPTHVDQFQCLLHDTNWYGKPASTLTNAGDNFHQPYFPAYKYLPARLADILLAAVPTEAATPIRKQRDLGSHYWIPGCEAFLGRENGQLDPGSQWGLFLGRALLEQPGAATLEREAAYPILGGGGDHFGWHKLAEAARAYAALGPPPGPSVNSLTFPATVGRRQKFEATFQITGMTATNTFLPYDAAPPSGQAIVGITVDGEFSDDNYATIIRRPAFWSPDFDEQIKGSGSNTTDWAYVLPTGKWTVRFSAPRTGTWRFRIRSTDAGGSNLSADNFLSVTASTAKGRVRPSTVDVRYFVDEQGNFTPIVGSNVLYKNFSWDDPTQQATPLLGLLGQNGFNYARYFNDFGLNGTERSAWLQAGTADQVQSRRTALNCGSTYVLTNDTATDSEVCGAVEPTGPTGLYVGTFSPVFHRRPPPCKRSTTYRFRFRYQLPVDITTPVDNTKPFGVVVKTSVDDQIWIPSTTNIQQPGVGTVLGTYITAATGTGWAEHSVSFTTRSNQDYHDVFGIAYENCTSGSSLYLTYAWLEEDLGGGNFGPNQFTAPSWSMHHQIDHRQARALERIVDAAEANGVYLQLVLWPGRGDYGLRRMTNAGDISLTPGLGTDLTWAGIANGRQDWLRKGFLRQVHARIGHSPAVLAYEATNEGDPYSASHARWAHVIGTYLRTFGDAPLFTTSTWFDCPKSFWDQVPSADLVTAHKYSIQTGPFTIRVDHDVIPQTVTVETSNTWFDSWEKMTLMSQAIGARQPYGQNRTVLFNEWGFYSNGQVATWLPLDTGGKYLHKALWAQADSGGLSGQGWWFDTIVFGNVTHPNSATHVPNFLPLFKRFHDWIGQFPLSTGHYVDAAAALSDSTNLRCVGQKDPIAGRAYLVIDNRADTAYNAAVTHATVTPRSGTFTISGLPSGRYRLTWTDPATGSQIQQDFVQSGGGGAVTGTLPAPLSTDIAVSIDLFSGGGGGGSSGSTPNTVGNFETWTAGVPAGG